MKKIVALLIASLFFITGCSFRPNVDTLNGWMFQYNEGTNDYSLFFSLNDSRNRSVAADASVKIRIVNENGENVYEGERFITPDDFSYYTNAIVGDRYMANVRISANDIKKGSSSSGKVFFTVTNPDSFAFDEVNCDALYCLPIKEASINKIEYPAELVQKDFMGNVESKIVINDVQYSFDTSLSPSLHVVISGEKTYQNGNSLSYDIISYKLYDSEGYLVDGGNVYLGTSLGAGDKFKDDSLVFYDVVPGEAYTLQLSDFSY